MADRLRHRAELKAFAEAILQIHSCGKVVHSQPSNQSLRVKLRFHPGTRFDLDRKSAHRVR
jgi:hypothetical protein